MDSTQILTLVIFSITYLGIVFTRLPGINVDRPSAAFSGAVAMIAFGILTPAQAFAAIDMNTIVLLLGMMILIATLQIDGFFTLLAKQTIQWSGNRKGLLSIITFITGISSAFLVNDAVVLMFTPVIIQICRSQKLNPIPYLIAEILASNIGSAMTITGNPQNMLIGLTSGIQYGTFLLHLLPIAILGMLVVVGLVRWIYRNEFRDSERLHLPTTEHVSRGKILRSGSIFALVVLAFFLGKQIHFSIPLIAIVGAALILLIGDVKPSEVIQKVDWVLLLFFASLFVVVGAVEHTGLLNRFILGNPLKADAGGIAFLHGSSLVFSQLVSNVPFVVLMLPMMKVASSTLLWLSLASASTLAGNATIIGAMANLIVIESAKREGVKIGFMEFLKVGLAVTLITLPLSMILLYAQHLAGWL